MAFSLVFNVQLFIPSATLQRIPATAPLDSLLVLSSEDILSPTGKFISSPFLTLCVPPLPESDWPKLTLGKETSEPPAPSPLSTLTEGSSATETPKELREQKAAPTF